MIDLFADRFAISLDGGVHTLDAITGTADPDTLNGTTGDDVILGKGGGDLISGDDGNDSIDGGAGDDTIFGGFGGDTILGGIGNDFIIAQGADDDTAADSVDGGDGADVILGGMGANTFDGGAGDDGINSYGDGSVLHGGDGADQIGNTGSISGAASSDMLFFGDGGDDILTFGQSSAKGAVGSSLYGGDGDDVLNIFNGASGHVGSHYSGGDGDDLIKARASGDDTIDGGAGFDLVSYIGRHYGVTCDLVDQTASAKGIGHDALAGIEGFIGGISDDVATGDGLANSLAGKNGLDLLIGAGGDDALTGGGRDDTLTGGLGADRMDGGGGHDTFVYNSVTESTDAAPDAIDHFKKHDVIDLSAIDADVNMTGDQAFVRVAAFDGHAGQMTLTFSGGTTLLKVDVDGDAQADMTIQLTGNVAGHTEFVL